MQATEIQLDPRVVKIIDLIDAEFDEMPGMRLTHPQVRRLWNVPRDVCEQALQHLCATGRLVCDPVGRYHRGDV